MTTPAKKPYHKKRHPWRDQDLRSDVKRAVEPRPGLSSETELRLRRELAERGRAVKVSARGEVALCTLCGLRRQAPRHVKGDMQSYHPFEESVPPIPLCIEIVESATGKVEKKLGPFSSERMRDKADDRLTRQLDHERFYTRFAS